MKDVPKAHVRLISLDNKKHVLIQTAHLLLTFFYTSPVKSKLRLTASPMQKGLTFINVLPCGIELMGCVVEIMIAQRILLPLDLPMRHTHYFSNYYEQTRQVGG